MQRLDRVQVSARAGQPDRPREDRLAEHHAKGLPAPQVSQSFRRPVGVRGDERAVDRPDGGADNDVGPHAGLGQRAQHAHLVRTEQPAAAEYECSRHLTS